MNEGEKRPWSFFVFVFHNRSPLFSVKIFRINKSVFFDLFVSDIKTGVDQADEDKRRDHAYCRKNRSPFTFRLYKRWRKDSKTNKSLFIYPADDNYRCTFSKKMIFFKFETRFLKKNFVFFMISPLFKMSFQMSERSF